MRSIIVSALVLLIILGLDGCFTPPTYSKTPQIQLLEDRDNFYFSKGTGNGLDELVVTLKFQDGDGDLGLSTNEADPIYAQQYFYIINSNGSFTQVTDIELPNVNYVNYRFKKKNPNLKLPDYNCTSWEFKLNSSGVRIDTIYTELNQQSFYNIFIDYYLKNNLTPSDTSYTKFDIDKFFAPSCPDRTLAGGRFPILSSDPGKVAPLDGTLRYSIRSIGLDIIFGSNTMKIRVRIQDRAFNKSNVVETRPFTLPSIRR